MVGRFVFKIIFRLWVTVSPCWGYEHFLAVGTDYSSDPGFLFDIQDTLDDYVRGVSAHEAKQGNRTPTSPFLQGSAHHELFRKIRQLLLSCWNHTHKVDFCQVYSVMSEKLELIRVDSDVLMASNILKV